MDDPTRLLTLTEAAAHCAHSRVALRQRVRRGTLAHVRGNDGFIRVRAGDLADLPPPSPDDPGDDRGQAGDEPGQDALSTMADILAATVADLTAARAALDRSQAERLADYGRAERTEAERDAERRRADDAEGRARAAAARLDKVEDELRDARRPWWERAIRAIKG